MEYTLDELLDITSDYLDQIDFESYFNDGCGTDVQDIHDRLVSDYDSGLLPRVPGPLEGNIFRVFDLWDLTVYLRNRYDMRSEEEVTYKYYLYER